MRPRGRPTAVRQHYDSLVVLRASGRRRHIVYAAGRLSASYPAWSPNGRSIAFVHTDIACPDGTGDGPVTDDISVPDGWSAWAPSGRALAISRLGRIWTLAADGSELRQLTHGPATAGDWDPSWQPRPEPQSRASKRLRRG